MTLKIENILRNGLLVKLFLSGGRLRVMRTEFDDPDPKAYYAEAPDLVSVFTMFNSDCEHHTTYEEKFTNEHPLYQHYLTGDTFMNKFDQGLSYGTWYFVHDKSTDMIKLYHSNLTFTCEAESLSKLINKVQDITRSADFRYEDYLK